MGTSCQRNGHWAATNYLSGRGLVQPIKKLSSAAGRCAGRGCALIRQLANWSLTLYELTLVCICVKTLQSRAAGSAARCWQVASDRRALSAWCLARECKEHVNQWSGATALWVQCSQSDHVVGSRRQRMCRRCHAYVKVLCLENLEILSHWTSCQRNVRKLSKSWGIVGGEILLGKLFIADFSFGAMPVFSSILHACLLSWYM